MVFKLNFFGKIGKKIIFFLFNSKSVRIINLGDLYSFLLDCFPILPLTDSLKIICLNFLAFADNMHQEIIQEDCDIQCYKLF